MGVSKYYVGPVSQSYILCQVTTGINSSNTCCLDICWSLAFSILSRSRSLTLTNPKPYDRAAVHCGCG